MKRAAEVVTTEAVLVEVGNAPCGTPRLRKLAPAFIKRSYTEENMAIVPVGNSLFIRALEVYESREDKEWGLTDCVSFVVMGDHGLVNAATGDRHFVQAGFRGLMLPPGYELEGRLLRQTGRRGEGPGELRDIARIGLRPRRTRAWPSRREPRWPGGHSTGLVRTPFLHFDANAQVLDTVTWQESNGISLGVTKVGRLFHFSPPLPM